MNKEETNKTECETKEFDRSVCFSFFKSYLEQGEKVNKLYGAEAAYNYFIALIEYGLYQKESEDELSNLLVSGLKNTIDANQKKRASAFESKENKRITESVLKFKAENPNATQREIASAVGCSLGKVNTALAKSNNANTNNYTNRNSNSNNNTNSMNVNMNTTSVQYVDTHRKRALEELTDEELESIKSDYKKRIHYKETEKRLNLNRTVTQETQKEVEELLAQRAQEVLKKKIASQVSALPEQKINEIAAYFDCDKSEVADSINYLGVDTEYLLSWISEHGRAFSRDNYAWKEMAEYYNDSYMEFVKSGIAANSVSEC